MEADAQKPNEMFAFEMATYAFVDIYVLDEQIASMGVNDESKQDLQEWRYLAERAYKEGQFDYAVAIIKATFCTAVYGKHALTAYPMARRYKTEKDAKTRPLLAVNTAKAAAKSCAQAIATELWQADITQEIRLGAMADKVYRALAAEGFAETLPGMPERIKEWIKPAAPDYARKGGRRKTP